jgi:hypothetical protein
VRLWSVPTVLGSVQATWCQSCGMHLTNPDRYVAGFKQPGTLCPICEEEEKIDE